MRFVMRSFFVSCYRPTPVRKCFNFQVGPMDLQVGPMDLLRVFCHLKSRSKCAVVIAKAEYSSRCASRSNNASLTRLTLSSRWTTRLTRNEMRVRRCLVWLCWRVFTSWTRRQPYTSASREISAVVSTPCCCGTSWPASGNVCWHLLSRTNSTSCLIYERQSCTY